MLGGFYAFHISRMAVSTLFIWLRNKGQQDALFSLNLFQ